MEERKFSKYKWITLIAFGLVYNLVYLGRFNVNNLMGNMSLELGLTETQQEMISMSVFISYAAGSFLNGYLADKYGAKKTVLAGVAVSISANMCISLVTDWRILLLFWGINGYFQSMIWLGGISMLSKWWKEGERGKGVGIANFASGLSHATAYLLPLGILAIWPAMEWRLNFILPMVVLMFFAYFFGITSVDRPEDKGLKPYVEENHRQAVREASLSEMMNEGKRPWRFLFMQKKFVWWCGIAMLSSICRYGLLNWIPMYYESMGEKVIISETFSNLTLPIGMAVGTLIVTWVAGTRLFNNMGVIVSALAALCGTLIVIFPMIEEPTTVLVGIFFTGFALYGINGLLWLHAIDQGCRVFPGSAAGILNGFAYLGACLEGVIFPMVIKVFHDMMSVFVVMEILCVIMVICGMVISKKNTVVVPEVRE